MTLETLDDSSFPIYKGQCRVDDDGVHIESNQPLRQDQVALRIVLSALITIYFLYRGISSYGHIYLGISIMYFFFVALNLYIIFISLNATMVTHIPLDKIRSVRYKKGFLLNIRPVITIRYFDEHNKPKKRMLVLPSMFKDGNEIMNQARSILSRYMD